MTSRLLKKSIEYDRQLHDGAYHGTVYLRLGWSLDKQAPASRLDRGRRGGKDGPSAIGTFRRIRFHDHIWAEVCAALSAVR